jgi:hypothetical protein
VDFGIFIAVFAISGGFAIAVLAMWLDSKKRHLRHVERMAMIEKGIAPSELTESFAEGKVWNPGSRRSQRSSGVFMICLGIGLGFMFYSQRGGIQSVWIGAFIAMFGVANLVNSLLDERDARRRQPPPPSTPPNP